MDPLRVLAVLCLVALIVVGINGILLIALLRRNPSREINLYRRVATTASAPWKEEDDALDELSRRVARLRRQDPEPEYPEQEGD